MGGAATPGKADMSEHTFYLTTPIYYINAAPHIGTGYTQVAADFICRFRRLQGRRVHFLTGTDEHGQKAERSAEAAGMKPKEYADSMIPAFTEVWKMLDISNDDFIRTTEERHEKAVAAFAQDLHDRGEIYLDTYEALYCVGCEEFKQPDQIVDGLCPLHGTAPEVVKEDNYFFRLSKYREALIERYENVDGAIMPESRRNEILGKLRQGLDDLSMSRVSFEWGVPVPWDSKHVIYVWIDALLNYITAIGYGSDESRFKEIWPADVHLVGKDILWFHSVIWPAMLMALELPVPKTVYAHGFLTVGGEKMSKSRATGISPKDLTATFGTDGYRYYFMRELSFGLDGEFSWESMVARYNADLANDLGNLASRVLSMITRYLDGVIPEPPTEAEIQDVDRSLRESFHEAERKMTDAMETYALREALEGAWGFVRRSNAYVEEVAPWKLAKDEGNKRRLEVVLYNLAEALRLIALITSPIIPGSAKEMWARLGIDAGLEGRSLAEDGGWGVLEAGARVTVGAPLFPRLEI